MLALILLVVVVGNRITDAAVLLRKSSSNHQDAPGEFPKEDQHAAMVVGGGMPREERDGVGASLELMHKNAKPPRLPRAGGAGAPF